MVKPVSLFELSVQDKLIWLDDAVVAARFVGAAGVAGVAVGLGVGLGVGVGVGVEVLIWIIFATEGMPVEFRMNSM